MERLEKHKSIETGKDTTNFENNSIKQIIFKLAKNIREKVINILELINDLYISTITGVPIEDIEGRNIFLKFIKVHYPEINIDKYLHIEDNFLVWDGDLNLRIIKELPNDIYFPDGITGDLFLSNLTKLPKNIKFPLYIRGTLKLDDLKDLTELHELPQFIGEDLHLNELTELRENIKLTECIGGSLYLKKVKKISKKFKLPEIGSPLYIDKKGKSNKKIISLKSIIDKLSVDQDDIDMGFPDYKYFPDNLDLGGLECLPEDFTFPERILGYLNLSNLTELPEDTTFPTTLRDLHLERLSKLPINIKFPEFIGRNLNLNSIENLPENIILPKKIGWSLNLCSLIELPKNFTLPESLGGLNLHSIIKLPDNFSFPQSMIGNLNLENLKELPSNIKLPEYIGGDLILNSLTRIPANTSFPESILGRLDIENVLELPENFIFPHNLNQSLILDKITELPNNIKLPDSIGGDLYLGNLEELPKDIKFPDHIGGSLILSNLKELAETIKINGNIMLNSNRSLTDLHNNIECRKLYIEDCPKLYTYKNYKIIKYLKDNKKIEEVVGFPIGEIEGMMKRVDNIVVAILSEQDSVVYERYQVLPEDITDRLIEESIYILEGVYESVNGYMLSKRDECIALKDTIERITRIEEYKTINKKLDKINKELKDRPRIVRDRLRSIFSDELWEKVVERLKEEDPDMVKFLNKK